MTEKVERYQMGLVCPLCDTRGFKNMTGHVLKGHGLSIADFRAQTGYEGPLVTKEHARMMAMRSNALWSSPEVRERRVQGIKDSYTPELREKRSIDALDQWNDPTIRSERSEAISWAVAGLERSREPRTPMSLLRKALYERAGARCESCGLSEEDSLAANGRRLHLHHKNYDRTVATLDDVLLLCGTCHKKLHNAEGPRERFPMVARAVGDLLKALGVDLLDENFVETPRRVATYLLEHFVGGSEFEESTESFEEATFPSEYDGMIMQAVSAVGMCPHHLLPVLYEGVVGYIPDRVTVGLSKLSRIAKQCLRTPILQEFGTLLVADTLSDVLKTEHVAVALRGKHLCMMIRGVEDTNSHTVTSELRGDFRDDPSCRAEFMSFVKGMRPPL